MSMIGLFTVAPQAAGTKTPAGDAAAAEGFGSMLQGALAALAQDAAGAEAPPADTELVELVEDPASTGSVSGVAPAATALPLVELVVTPTGNAVPASTPTARTPDSGESSATGSVAPNPASENAPTPGDVSLVELVVTPTGNAFPASTSSANAVASATTPIPLVKPSETRTSSVAPASTGSASGPIHTATALPLVELVETPTGNAVPASTSSASGAAPVSPTPVRASTSPASGVAPAATPVSLVELGATLPVPNDAPASVGRAVGSETPTSRPVPASTGSASGVASASGATAKQVETVASLASTSSASPASVSTPAAVAPTQSLTPSAPIAPPAPAAPLATQLARPIFSLATAGVGEHVMTVSVTPDNLGPVTVRAHVGPEGVRVELFAPNDLGRDAIRTIIPDLRRDLAGAGLGGNLTLSSQNQPSSDGSPQGTHAGQQGERDAGRDTTRRAFATDVDETPEPEPHRPPLFGTTSTIDVFA